MMSSISSNTTPWKPTPTELIILVGLVIVVVMFIYLVYNNTLVTSVIHSGDPLATIPLWDTSALLSGYESPNPFAGDGTDVHPYTAPDATGGIQTTVNQLETADNGGLVWLGNSRWSLDAPIVITKSNMVLKSANASTPTGLNISQYGSALILSTDVPSAILTAGSNADFPRHLQFREMAIYGSSMDGVDLNLNVGIRFDAPNTQSVVENSSFSSLTAGLVITVQAITDNLKVINNSFDATGVGIYFYPGGINYNACIKDNTIRDTKLMAIYLGQANFVVASGYINSGCIIEGNTLVRNCQSTDLTNGPRCSVYIGNNGTLFNNNFVAACQGYGLYIAAPDVSTINVTGNTFKDNVGSSIFIQGDSAGVNASAVANRSTISGNVFQISHQHAIDCGSNGLLNTNIVGNTFQNSTGNLPGVGVNLQDGVAGQGTTAYSLISSNTFSGFNYAVYVGAYASHITVGVNMYQGSLTADVYIATNATNTTVILCPGMVVVDNGTTTVLQNYNLVGLGLVTLRGTPTGQVHA